MKLFLTIALLTLTIIAAIFGCNKKSDGTIEVNTAGLTGITGTSAICGGIITNDGGSKITARGVCWDTAAGPTIALNTKTTDGAGTGSYTSNITGLNPGTLYYLRAYAINNKGTFYGHEIKFAASAIYLPVITTEGSVKINDSSVQCGGNIMYSGGSPIIARGVCWDTHPGPTVALATKTTDSVGTGKFTSKIIGLQGLITYYFRAYATNASGTAYGDEQKFTLTLPIGTKWGGGTIIYYLLPSDLGFDTLFPHGLVAVACPDKGSWYNHSKFTLTGANGRAIGTGRTNTDSILKKQGFGLYAAWFCGAMTTGGYKDWYLPSIDELNIIFKARKYFGTWSTVSPVGYWSSSEAQIGGDSHAWSIEFVTGNQAIVTKDTTLSLFAVRSF